ncbi:AAA family ATPase [Ramlibacter ginsenosidimutans]|uniref:AAA family ATPase n=1 Tax=Ramlibacter ginsenosidimutans TaxID=502333 RepID=A0A934WPS8_9BURK|nr:AAA family ATPase [Ramlibacter ginsenosidimutans]MBK6008660.1 AAA family ATPase [Ramlibacter ginsenosidimutans]
MARSPASGADPLRVRFGDFELDEANARLLQGGKPLTLAPTPFNLLCALARRPGSLLTKDALLDAVWGHQFVSESVLKTAISDLRTVLSDDPRAPRVIETVPRRGYRFIAPTAATALQAAVVPEPFTPTQRPAAPSFVGRAEALGRLDRAWAAAAAGKRSLVWVAGEPGIGKTTLVDRFVSGIAGAACARGHCVEHYGTGEPYLPVLEALADLSRNDPQLPALLRMVAPTWLLQLPWLSPPEERDALRRELSGVGPERMLREMGELLDRYAQDRPLLLVTEDLHWSDRSTLQLIDYLARRRNRARLLWVATFRLAEVVASNHPVNALRHELRVHRLCEEVVLDPFSEREVADYVAQASGALAGDEAFVHGLHERTDGVPLFVAALLGDVLARGEEVGPAAPHEQLEGVGVPENLAAIIDQYLARLDKDDRDLLAAAAVCGMEFQAEAVAEMTGRELASAAERCERLARAQFWLTRSTTDVSAERPYAFRHALFRQVLYERTAPAVRVQLHARAGAVLETQRAAGHAVAAAELAMHFERGREPVTALRYYAQAAEASLQLLSPGECLALVDRALPLLESMRAGDERNGLAITLWTLRGLASVHVHGFGSDAKKAYQRAYALLGEAPDHRLRGLLLDGLGFVLGQRAEYDEALALAERAAALWSLTEDPVLLLTACYVQGDVHMLKGRPRIARQWIERALPALAAADAKADAGFGAQPQVMLLGLLALQCFHLGLTRQAHAHIQDARARAQQLSSPAALVLAIWMEAMLEIRLGRHERVAALAQEMAQLSEEAAFTQARNPVEWYRGWAQARQGQAREGFARIRAAYEANTALGMLSGGSEILGYAAEALLLAGDCAGAGEQLAQALAIVEARGERVYLPQLCLLQAAIARQRGDAAASEEAVYRALAEAREQQAPWHELLALLALCEHHAAAGERQELATLLAQLPEAADTPQARKARALLAAA